MQAPDGTTVTDIVVVIHYDPAKVPENKVLDRYVALTSGQIDGFIENDLAAFLAYGHVRSVEFHPSSVLAIESKYVKVGEDVGSR